MSVRLPLRSADVSWKLRLHIPCLCVQHEGMRIHPRTTSSLAVAFAQLVAPFARRPLGTQPLFKSSVWHVGLACSAEPAAAVTTAAAHASGGDDGGVLAISRQERKRARKTRSFRRRQAPITRGQRRTLRELWPKYGLVGDFNSRWRFEEIFSNPAAINFDIGFGSGASLIEMATERPNENFVGIEVHKPGVAAALARVEEGGLRNVKIVQGDAVTALTDHIEDRSLSSCCIFFPDPFPEDRDAERRLVRPLLLSLLSSKLRPGGMLHVATDVEGYAEHTKRVVTASLLSPKPSTATEEKQDMLSSSSSSLSPQTAVDTVEAAAAASAKEGRLKHPEKRHTRGVEEQILPGDTTDGGHRPPWQQRQQQAEDGGGRENISSRSLSDEVRWEGGEAAERPSWRPLTKYEEKAREAGRRVRDFSYRLELQAASSCSPSKQYDRSGPKFPS